MKAHAICIVGWKHTTKQLLWCTETTSWWCWCCCSWKPMNVNRHVCHGDGGHTRLIGGSATKGTLGQSWKWTNSTTSKNKQASTGSMHDSSTDSYIYTYGYFLFCERKHTSKRYCSREYIVSFWLFHVEASTRERRGDRVWCPGTGVTSTSRQTDVALGHKNVMIQGIQLGRSPDNDRTTP